MDRILGWTLPVDYLHCVFTLPHEFNPLIQVNHDTFYRLIFLAVSATVSAIAREKFGCRIGIVMVLHTWGQRMNRHVHVHVIVTCGGLALDGSRWVEFAKSDWESAAGKFSPAVLAQRYRAEFLRGVRRLFRRQELILPKSITAITTLAELEMWLAPVKQKRWCVDVQGAPEGYEGPHAVLNYLAGYVVGAAIQDRRILRYDGRCVVISAKNYRTGQLEELPMTGEEFVRRFALHILPDRLVRIRYAGMFCARYRKSWLARCHQLLGSSKPDDGDTGEASPDERTHEEGLSEPLPGPTCARCDMPGMVSVGNRTAEQTASHLRQLCLLFDRMFTWVTTIDLDRPTRSQKSDSFVCFADGVVISCDSTTDGPDTAMTALEMRIPDT